MSLFVVLVDVAVSKFFSTEFALVRLVFAMDDLVGSDLIQAFKGAAADFTGVWSFL